MENINFSDLTRSIIQSSGRLAVQFRYSFVEPEHLLLAIIDECIKNPDKNVVLKIFKHFKVNLFELIEDVERTFDSPNIPIADRKIPFTKKTEYILKLTHVEANRCHSIKIEAEHVFLSYLRAETAFSEKTLNHKYNLIYEPVKDYVKNIV
jgi:ATP-dependent Clp protease ATP-binding subunit ClpA